MATRRTHPQSRRDGTSQAGRRLAALDPDSAPIDQRDIGDWLRFTQGMGQELRFFDEDDRLAGDWSGLLGTGEERIAEIQAFLADPAAFQDEAAAWLRRPHLALFLAFLKIHQDVQAEINGLTRRHLDFYYRDLLKLTPRAGRPDRVHVLFDLDQDSGPVRVPKGTELDAGKDSQGKDRVYRTERELLVNAANLARASSVFAHQQIFGIEEAAAAFRKTRRDQDFLRLLSIPLGDPPPDLPTGQAFDLDRLADVETVLRSGKPQAELTPQAIEAYFFASAADILKLIDAYRNINFTDADWREVDVVLRQAHKNRVDAGRRAELVRLHHTPAGLQGALERVLGSHGVSLEDGLLRLEVLLDGEAFQTAASLARSVRDGSAPSDHEWNQLLDILHLAWRNCEGEPAPPRRKDWLNLFAAEDAMLVKPNPAATEYWSTFGQRPIVYDQALPPPSPIGLAVASPLLLLSEGKRTVELKLSFSADRRAVDDLQKLLNTPGYSLFQAQLTTADGWITPPGPITCKFVPAADTAALDALDLSMELEADFSAVIAPLQLSGSPPETMPALKLLPRPFWDESVFPPRYQLPYQILRALRLEGVSLAVEVAGLKTLQLQTDQGEIDPASPFEPFGLNPSVGSALCFTHPELAAKRLNKLEMTAHWMGAPADLKAHYQNYGGDLSSSAFTATLSLVEQRLPISLNSTLRLFADDPRQPAPLGIPDIPGAINATRPGFQYLTREPLPAAQGPVTEAFRHFRLELNSPDFQHGAYPALAMAKSLQLAADIAKLEPNKTITPQTYQLNPPYTPKLKSLTVDYGASAEIALDGQPPRQGSTCLYHIHPFGWAECAAEPNIPDQPQAGTSHRLLPEYDGEGALYLGLAGVDAPQTLSLLFQMAEGSAQPDLPVPPVAWSYLSGNRWIAMDLGQVRADETRGLLNTGIVQLRLEAADPAVPNTLMPHGHYWLRARVEQDCAALCGTVAIQPQAVCANFEDRGIALDHLAQPLPPETIKEPSAPLPGIAGIRQPYSSFAGKLPEQEREFRLRVAERLRHKNRSLTPWDYEHLVLERFPQLHQVKCLSATLAASEETPGSPVLIVIPDLRGRLPSDPFRPKVPSGLLVDIEDYLATLASPLARPQVRNARVVFVKLRFAVRYYAACNPAFYNQQLNEELNRYLAPWAYDEGADVVLGGRLYANAIIDFVERRPYVDFLAGLKLFSSEDGDRFRAAPEPGEDGYYVAAGRPDAVLVPAPRHEFDLVNQTRFVDERFTGIGFMKVELDFVVG